MDTPRLIFIVHKECLISDCVTFNFPFEYNAIKKFSGPVFYRTPNSLDMFVPYEIKPPWRVLSLELYLLLVCCIVPRIDNTRTRTTFPENDTPLSFLSFTNRWECQAPTPPLIVTNAFVPNNMNHALPENNYNTVSKRRSAFDPNTTVVLDCLSSQDASYVMVHNGTTRLTCVQTDETTKPTWDGPMPKCGEAISKHHIISVFLVSSANSA